MTSKITLSCITLFALLLSNLTAFEFKAKGNSYSGKTTVETEFLYSKYIYKSLLFKHNLSSQISHDEKFSRFNKNNNLNWLFILDDKKLKKRLKFNYKYIYDKANLDEASYKLWKRNRSIGLGLSYLFNPQNSVNFDFDYYYNRENDRTGNIKQYLNRGFSSRLNAESNFKFNQSNIKITPFYNLYNLNYQNKNEIGSTFNYKWQNSSQSLATNFKINRFSDDIYAYQTWTDKQIKSTKEFFVNCKTKLYDWLFLTTDFTNYFEDNFFELDLYKKYTLNKNLSYSKLSAFYKNFSFSTYFTYNEIDKKYKQDINSRVIIEKKLENSLSYNYAKTDSIIFNFETDLIKTSYPNLDNVLDNDRLNNVYSLAFYTYIKNKILLYSLFAFSQNHDVYVLSQMSANNIKKRIFNFKPAVYSLFGKMQISQVYHLRADYDRWDYALVNNQIRYNKIYRKFTAGYNWTFFSKVPKIVSENNLKSQFLDSLDWYIDVFYQYDTNEFGDEISGLYQKSKVNEYHKLTIDLQKRFNKFIFRLKPKADWTSIRQFSSLLEVKYILSNNKKAVIGFNPDGTTFKNINWRFYCELNYAF